MMKVADLLGEMVSSAQARPSSSDHHHLLLLFHFLSCCCCFCSNYHGVSPSPQFQCRKSASGVGNGNIARNVDALGLQHCSCHNYDPSSQCIDSFCTQRHCWLQSNINQLIHYIDWFERGEIETSVLYWWMSGCARIELKEECVHLAELVEVDNVGSICGRDGCWNWKGWYVIQAVWPRNLHMSVGSPFPCDWKLGSKTAVQHCGPMFLARKAVASV